MKNLWLTTLYQGFLNKEGAKYEFKLVYSSKEAGKEDIEKMIPKGFSSATLKDLVLYKEQFHPKTNGTVMALAETGPGNYSGNPGLTATGEIISFGGFDFLKWSKGAIFLIIKK